MAVTMCRETRRVRVRYSTESWARPPWAAGLLGSVPVPRAGRLGLSGPGVGAKGALRRLGGPSSPGVKVGGTKRFGLLLLQRAVDAGRSARHSGAVVTVNPRGSRPCSLTFDQEGTRVPAQPTARRAGLRPAGACSYPLHLCLNGM